MRRAGAGRQRLLVLHESQGHQIDDVLRQKSLESRFRHGFHHFPKQHVPDVRTAESEQIVHLGEIVENVRSARFSPRGQRPFVLIIAGLPIKPEGVEQ